MGRSLWHPEKNIDKDKRFEECGQPQSPAPCSGANVRDGCLGAGAHNTYWDGHSEGVGEVMDELTLLGCKETAQRPSRPTAG